MAPLCEVERIIWGHHLRLRSRQPHHCRQFGTGSRGTFREAEQKIFFEAHQNYGGRTNGMGLALFVNAVREEVETTQIALPSSLSQAADARVSLSLNKRDSYNSSKFGPYTGRFCSPLAPNGRSYRYENLVRT